MQYEMLTSKIIGCAMNVHRALGNGFQEVIYQRALEIEMQQANLNFVREMEMPIFYKNVQTRRVDFFVENLIMVELKALTPFFWFLGENEVSQGCESVKPVNFGVSTLIESINPPNLEVSKRT